MPSLSKSKNSRLNAKNWFRDAELKEEHGDFAGAFRSLSVAAGLGDAGSLINLGNFYSAGKGVRKDLRAAARCYKKAYRNGRSEGALNLAVDLEREGNLRAAITWLERAIAMNDGDAHLRLEKLAWRVTSRLRISGAERAIPLTNQNAPQIGQPFGNGLVTPKTF